MSDNPSRVPVFIVSAYLLGINTHYDGVNSLNKNIVSLLKKGIVIP